MSEAAEKMKLKLGGKPAASHTLPTGVLGLALHPDQRRAFAACMDGVYQLDLESGTSEKLYEHASYASGVVCIHENETLVSAGYDGALIWFDLASKKTIRTIAAHGFWSWDLARASDVPIVVSCTGQYLAGSYDYLPQKSAEPTVRVYDALSGQEICVYEHLPPVQSVAISKDGQRVAAGNLMGDVAVWAVGGRRLAKWNTPDFTGFGIIKTHCQVGGIYATAFSPGDEVLVAGMGPMRDPMAGNGKQRWQRFAWQEGSPKKTAEAKNDQMGEGLMETLCLHPQGDYFVMAGRLRGGSWNAGLFELASSNLVGSVKTGGRIAKACFSDDGKRLMLASARKQTGDAKKHFGRVEVFEVSDASA